MGKCRIGIAANILIMEGGIMPGLYRSYVNNDYVESLEKAGCVPVLLPVISDLDSVKDQIEGLDGIVLSGGYDIDPTLYGEQPMLGQGFAMREVDCFYIAVIKAAAEANIPIFGICKGVQAINVAFGGTIYQDLNKKNPDAFQHTQQAPRGNASHVVCIEKESFLGKTLDEKTFVNSYHHQAVKDVAEGFRVTARAEDGIVEGIERVEGSFVCGVQWHPEMMAKFDNPMMIELFKSFAEKCK